MWFFAGVLLGLALLVAVVGFHAGPHLHAAAVVLGVVAAVLLVALAVGGHSSALLWSLLTVDLAACAAVGVAGWKGLSSMRSPSRPAPGVAAAGVSTAHKAMRVEGAEGAAVTDLDPQGIVRVCGERWSATSLNGFVAAGDPVQVIRVDGVRLAVWGELGLAGSDPRGGAGGEGRHPAFEPLSHEPLLPDPAAEPSGGNLEGGAK
jgi:membrane protein implicated in regulation of membrane protease activity